MQERAFSWRRGFLGLIIFGDDNLFERFIGSLKGVFTLLEEKDREIARLKFENALKEISTRPELIRAQIDAIIGRFRRAD